MKQQTVGEGPGALEIIPHADSPYGPHGTIWAPDIGPRDWANLCAAGEGPRDSFLAYLEGLGFSREEAEARVDLPAFGMARDQAAEDRAIICERAYPGAAVALRASSLAEARHERDEARAALLRLVAACKECDAVACVQSIEDSDDGPDVLVGGIILSEALAEAERVAAGSEGVAAGSEGVEFDMGECRFRYRAERTFGCVSHDHDKELERVAGEDKPEEPRAEGVVGMFLEPGQTEAEWIEAYKKER